MPDFFYVCKYYFVCLDHMSLPPSVCQGWQVQMFQFVYSKFLSSTTSGGPGSVHFFRLVT